jgi:hypothetical protein
VYFADGYDLEHSPSAAAAFPGNEIVVLAYVGEALPARWNMDSRTDGDLAFIFTPMQVSILEVLRGEPRLINETMIIRRLGGRVGDEELIVSDSIAAGGLVRGNRVLLFLGSQRDIGGIDAATPNMAYVLNDKDIATSSDGQFSIGLEDFRALIASAPT